MGSIRVVRGAEIPVGARTEGVVRKVADVDESIAFGELRCPPQTMSGWHHHGDRTTCAHVCAGQLRVEWGPAGDQGADLLPGDFYVVPANTIHREGNPGTGEQVLVGFYVGSGEPVTNVEGPGAAGTVRVFRSGDLAEVAGGAGMTRGMSDAAQPVGVGVMRCAPGSASGWHHHGEHTTCVYIAQGRVRVEWGAGGGRAADLIGGDVYVQSANAIHRETNVGPEELVLVGFELGTGPQVVNVAAAEPGEAMASGTPADRRPGSARGRV